MRVAYILPYLAKPSGWRSHSRAFLQAIRAYVEPVLFVAESDVQAAKDLFPGDKIIRLPVTQQASWSSLRGAGRLLACRLAIQNMALPPVELVHSLEAYPTGQVGDWLARGLNCAHVITTHGTYGVVWYEKMLDRWAYQGVLQRARLVCPVSQGTARKMEQYFSEALSRTPVAPILNGNDFFSHVQREEALDRPTPSTPTLLTVGDVKPRKGQHISIAAFARVKERVPQARYILAGGYQHNEYFERLRKIIAKHDIDGVIFSGRVPDQELDRLYRQASVFVLTPQEEGLHFEGFGLVYLEAGAYGLPVVGTRSGGVADAVKEGVTGVLLDPGDIEGIAEAIVGLITDPEMNRQMGRANREWAETLTWENTAAEQIRMYQEILSSK